MTSTVSEVLSRRIIAVVVAYMLVGCDDSEDWRDHNRPPTYGSQCEMASDCASSFECLGPPDAGAYWPICTRRCTEAADCPTWNATGYCAGPITPLCTEGLCDYQRCE
jgi:hypothetical protein